MEIVNMVDNSKLIAAVESLYRDGVIQLQKEIGEKTGYDETQVSNRVLKKVRKMVDSKMLCLKSENPEFDDIEIKRTDIKQMFLVLGKITKDVL